MLCSSSSSSLIVLYRSVKSSSTYVLLPAVCLDMKKPEQLLHLNVFSPVLPYGQHTHLLLFYNNNHHSGITYRPEHGEEEKRKHKTHANRETDRWTVTKQGEREEERVAKETRGTTVWLQCDRGGNKVEKDAGDEDRWHSFTWRGIGGCALLPVHPDGWLHGELLWASSIQREWSETSMPHNVFWWRSLRSSSGEGSERAAEQGGFMQKKKKKKKETVFLLKSSQVSLRSLSQCLWFSSSFSLNVKCSHPTQSTRAADEDLWGTTEMGGAQGRNGGSHSRRGGEERRKAITFIVLYSLKHWAITPSCSLLTLWVPMLVIKI